MFAETGEFSSSLISHSLECQMVQSGSVWSRQVQTSVLEEESQEVERGVNWRKVWGLHWRCRKEADVMTRQLVL